MKNDCKPARFELDHCMRTWKTFLSSPAVWCLAVLAVVPLGLRVAGQASDPLAIVGTQGWERRAIPRHPVRGPRINVLEVDTWKHSLEGGTLRPVAMVPFARRELIHPQNFSPDFYRQQIETLGETYARQRDVLMYYGALPSAPNHHGLNFNAWSTEDLRRLRAMGSRPFIGLETMDLHTVESMALKLHQAGYGPLNRIYVRICSEPSGMAYGSEDGTAIGKRHTAAAYAAYKRSFARVSLLLNKLNKRYGLDIYSVFAGTSADDFKSYQPPEYLFDALGYDLYVTPENKEKTLEQMESLRRHHPWKPIVIPELGVATAGPGASPRWAQETLGDILMSLGRHPAGVEGLTVFSVNVAGRLPKKRWSWAWTPVMFEILKEWESAPRRWRKDGFHRYDPLAYPVGRDILYIDRPDLRIVYRKLAAFKSPGVPLFYEARLVLHKGRWTHRTRIITLG